MGFFFFRLSVMVFYRCFERGVLGVCNLSELPCNRVAMVRRSHSRCFKAVLSACMSFHLSQMCSRAGFERSWE